MAEPRKNHHTIDGGQVKEDDHIVSTYKPIPENDTDYRHSKSSLSKSKEKLSADGAEEKLLQKEDEAKITTRVDMADAKYVVGDHRNGDAKIELDANKKQFSGLTKEELLKYADDPFWVRLRWFMFVLFWGLWLGMLAGAIAIIVRAPKCAPPPARTWFEVGPLADRSSADYAALEEELPHLESSKVQGVFITPCDDSYEILEDSPSCVEQFKSFVEKAKEHSIKVIVDLTANFVSSSHKWFTDSANRSSEFDQYFVWAVGKNFNADQNRPDAPNNWVSTVDESAWAWNEGRKEYYLHQYGSNQPDLNFSNKLVVDKFDSVLKKWMAAGAAGVRLLKARQLLVNTSLPSERQDTGHGSVPGATHLDYSSLRHQHTTDQPQLDALFAHWSHIVATATTDETVFTLGEDGRLAVEFYRLNRNTSSLRPPSGVQQHIDGNITAAAKTLADSLGKWPAIQLSSDGGEEAAGELALLAMLLPAAPVLGAGQPPYYNNDTDKDAQLFSHVAALRTDASIQHGHYAVQAVPAVNSSAVLLACARWKSGHTGYAAVYNPTGAEARANLTALPSLPATLTVQHISHAVHQYTNYTNNESVQSDGVLVPPMSSIILSYVPKTTAEK